MWMAWAMSKAGGKLVTIEVDERRHQTALKSFEAAGVAKYVDARLADAHELVKELTGPFDFVFSDADKEWYTQYFKELEGKLAAGGCFTAHNVLDGFAGVDAFLDYVRARPNYTTTIARTSRSGISVSCRTKRPRPKHRGRGDDPRRGVPGSGPAPSSPPAARAARSAARLGARLQRCGGERRWLRRPRLHARGRPRHPRSGPEVPADPARPGGAAVGGGPG